MLQFMVDLLRMPAQAATHAAEIDNMIAAVHWLMLVMFVGWGGYFVFVLFRFRAGANPKASYTGAKGKLAKYSEIGVAIIEVILLVVYAIPAWAMRVAAFPPESEAVVIRVVGKQFEWQMHYAGPDGKFGRRDVKLVAAENPIGLDRTDPDAKDDIVDTNNLTIPIDRPILVQLSSLDVIHSFGLVEMRVKQDAVPGMEIPVWFIPNKVGEFEIACSQLCGLGHYRMRGFIHVKTQAEYDAWMAEQQKGLAR
jgi:cytochrome c oxidase subunit II